MIFSRVIGVENRGFHIDATALERIGVFHESVCWGVWVPDPRGMTAEPRQRKHLLISPIHPSVWPFLLALEIKLRDAPGMMKIAAELLVNSHLNIQFAESAISGHHHATWNVVAEAFDIRAALHTEFRDFQRLPEDKREYTNHALTDFATNVANAMLRKEVQLPTALVNAHRQDPSYVRDKLDCGFLHNRIVDRTQFFYKVEGVDEDLRETARARMPQAVTCRWMQNLAFFALYGDVANPLKLQYDESLGVLRLVGSSTLNQLLKRQGQAITLPARALASFDTSELYLRIDMIKPTEAWDRYLESTVTYDIEFGPPGNGSNDTAAGLWLSVCEQLENFRVDLVKIANRTTDRDLRDERGSIVLIGRAEQSISDDFIHDLNRAIKNQCQPQSSNTFCRVEQPITNRFRSYEVFLSRRTNMPDREKVEEVISEIGRRWGLEIAPFDGDEGDMIDPMVESRLLEADGLLQIMSYSRAELAEARGKPEIMSDPQWLFYEYGMAVGAGKPHARIFDTSIHDVKAWQPIVLARNTEIAGYIDVHDDREKIRQALEPVVARLARKIHRSRLGRLDRGR